MTLAADRVTRAAMAERPAMVTYVLPIRRPEAAGPPHAEMTEYLSSLAERCHLVIVDGSDAATFASADSAWCSFAEHRAPDPDLDCLNGKVRGVLTGLRHARCDRVIIADDDVRYDPTALARMIDLLADHDLVVPQNYFEPAPWHARWDTARTLLNRCFGADYPGTLGVRRELLLRAGGYDGDGLFENLELMRTIAVLGGRSISPLDLYVRRLPPTTQHFLSQRVRQAYDEFARPARLVASLSLLPLMWSSRAHPRRLAIVSAASIVLAERGRRRAGGTTVFPATASLLAPLWLLERAVCSWLALWSRCRGGCTYAGRRVPKAATSVRSLKRQLG